LVNPKPSTIDGIFTIDITILRKVVGIKDTFLNIAIDGIFTIPKRQEDQLKRAVKAETKVRRVVGASSRGAGQTLSRKIYRKPWFFL